MEIKKTCRGFSYYEFEDLYGAKYSIQESSLADKEAIWFGIDDPNPKILASRVDKDLTGWVKYPLPEDVEINTRMHLSREQVKELLPILLKFVETGNLED